MTDEQENVENKKDEKYKKNEKNGDKTGYYVKQPIFGTGKPSWLKQQFGKTVAIVVGALTCILFYFLLSSGIYADLLSGSGKASQSYSFSGKPCFLCMGGTGLCDPHAVFQYF